MGRISGMRWALLAMIVTLGIGIATLGLLGALLFILCAPVLWALFGWDALDVLPPDSMWPIAIYITLLWPPSIPVAYLLVTRFLPPSRRIRKIASFMIVLMLWAAFLSVGCYLAAGGGR